jgi:hypothetical protein
MDATDSTQEIERAKLEVERDALHLNIKRARLRVMQLEVERTKILDNIAATEKAIAEKTDLIDAMGDDTDG